MSSSETAQGDRQGDRSGGILGGGQPLLIYLRHDDPFDDAGLKDKLSPESALRAFPSNPWLSWEAPNG
jgi:hypothetical protein